MNRDEIKLFWLEPTNQAQRYLRRYAGIQHEERVCPGPYKYHDAKVILSVNCVIFAEDRRSIAALPEHPKSDERWPAKCDYCDFVFDHDCCWQHGQTLLYRRTDTDKLITPDVAPWGAMWDAWWYGDHSRGEDGIVLIVKTPGGEWTVDGEASNCKARKLKHQCWPRTGNPRDPQGNPPLDVAKNGGCKVGAGSIGIGSKKHGRHYHGFLNKGYLRTKRK